MSNPYDTASERESILGPTLRFKGELSAEENLVIQGHVEGTIGPVPRVTVGGTATVHATIDAAIVIIEGTVVGDVKATSSVIVRETAKLTGNISAPAVSITAAPRCATSRLATSVMCPRWVVQYMG